MYPARTSSLWLATSASAGASRRVGIKSCDQRCMVMGSNRERILIVNDEDSKLRVAGQFEFALKAHGFSRAVTPQNQSRLYSRWENVATERSLNSESATSQPSTRPTPLYTRRRAFPTHARLRPCYKSASHRAWAYPIRTIHAG